MTDWLPCGMVTEFGIRSLSLVVATETARPCAGGALRVMVQVLEAPGAKVTGAHTSEVRPGGADGDRVSEIDDDAPFIVAVKTAVSAAVMAPAAAVKEAAVPLAGTVTEAGTETSGVLLASATTVPPAGAGWFRITVQVVALPEVSWVLVQAIPTGPTGTVSANTKLTEIPLKLAVTVAFWRTLTVPATIVKVAVVASAGTVRNAGAMSAGLSLEIDTVAPPERAGFVSVTVQVVAAPDVRDLSVQETAANAGGVTNDNKACREELLKVAVSVAF